MVEQHKDAVPYRVLTLDGGGIRGLYTASKLDHLNTLFAKPRGADRLDIGAGFDLIVGTSTGGILACALAHGLSTQQIVSLYREHGPAIFQNPMPVSGVKLMKWLAKRLSKPANRPDTLRAELESLFGSTTLEDLYSRREIALCVPTVNMGTCGGWVFKTPHKPEFTRDKGYSLVDVCLATSAAPVYFPLHAACSPNDQNHHTVFADGGLWANNPVLIGLIEALELSASDQSVEIISISTGGITGGHCIVKDDVDWGVVRWKAGTTILSTALDSQALAYSFMADKLSRQITDLGKNVRVYRLPHTNPSPEQLPHWGLDRATPQALQALSDLGKRDAENVYSRAMNGGSDMDGIAAIFESMPQLPRGKEN